MYNNPYINQYNPQLARDRIDSQIAQLQQMREQIPQATMQQPSINQTFQLAPNNASSIKYVNTIDDVNKEMVFAETPYFSKDMSVVWIKNTKGEIRTYELNEIKPLDEKDIKIQYLEEQIEELKKERNNEYITNDDPRFNEQNATKDDEPNGNATKNEKSTSIQRVSTSKKK